MQLAIFSLTYVNYGVLHATRSSWSLVTADLRELYGFSVGIVGDMNTTFLFCYSVGNFFLSHLGDKYNKNILIFTMYTMIAIVEVALGSLMFFSDLHAWPFFIIKALNGTLQSFAWAVNFAILCNWFPRKGRGLLIGVWATNPSVGDIFGQQLFGVLTSDPYSPSDWGYVFMTLGGCVFFVGLVNLIFLVEYPSAMGLEIKERG